MNRLLASMCSAVVIALLSGCGNGDSGSDGAGGEAADAMTSFRIGMMPKLVGISYFDAAERGAKQAAKELGVDLVYDGPTAASAEEQAEMVDSWVAQGFDVIAVAPNDPDAIASHLAGGKHFGSTVMTWDTDASEKSRRELFVNQAESDALGNSLVDVMVEGAAEDGKLKGKFLIISGVQTAANQNAWMAVMKPRLEAEHPDCILLETLYPGEDQRKSQEQAANALSTHADLKGIWAITSVALPAAAKAVRDLGRQDEIYVTGLSLPSQMREYVKDGTVKKFVLWDVEALGYLTVHVASRLKSGSLEPGTYDFGRLSGIQVSDSQVLLGDPLVFDAENIDQYDF